MKWLLNTTPGKATFSSGRKSRLVFRSCQQPRELHQGSQDAEKGTHSLLLSRQRGVTARRKRASQPRSLPGEKVRGTAAEGPAQQHVCAQSWASFTKQCQHNPRQNRCPHAAESTRCAQGKAGGHVYSRKGQP